MPKANTRVPVDIPTIDHKRLKMLAAYHGKSMRELFVELIKNGMAFYEECSYDHTPNEETIKVIKDAEADKNLHSAGSVKELFEMLDD